MLYLDANVFIYSLVDSGEKGKIAHMILESVVTGKDAAITSSLTIDEVLWILLKNTERKTAILEVLKIFEMQNLEIVGVTPDMSFKSLLLMQKYKGLKPRDAIHAAVCLSSGVFRIASDDADFDQIKELERMKL